MKDFDRWFRGFMVEGDPAPSAEPDEADLPANIRFNGGKGEDKYKYHALCCCCDRWGPLYVAINEITPLDDYEHYCGGSDRCCP